MIRQYVNNLNLPEKPGIYVFKDYKKMPLYIGRATSLRSRVKSYFANDLIKTRGPRIIDMVTKSKSMTYETTDSVLEAIILESNLIRKYQPKYNVDDKDDKSSQYVIITDEAWPRVFTARARDIDIKTTNGTLPYKIKEIFGPFPYSGLIKEALHILRKIFPFKDKKSLDARHDHFYKSIGRSPNSGDETDDEANKLYQKTIKYLILFFQGKKKTIKTNVMKDMIRQANSMKFEEAERSKKLLYALDHISDIALIKRETDAFNTNHSSINSSNGDGAIFRMEAYDVAHLSGTNVVGTMVVMINGEKMKPEYRKFNLSKQENNDTASLAEILLRRFNHTEWTYPDLIIVDGNQMQMQVAQSVLKSRRLSIPIIAVTKDARHRAISLVGDEEHISKYKAQIVEINAEAHRFTIAYHRNKRSKSFKPVIQ